MKRKILALLLSLAMLLSVGGMVEGTLAVGISVDSTRSSVTLGEVDPVGTPTPEAEPTVEPEVTPEGTPETTPETTPDATPAPDTTPAETPTPEVSPETTPVAENDLYDRLMACQTLEEIEAIIKGTPEDVLKSLSEEQVAQVEAYMDKLMPAPLPAIVIEESEPPVESEIYRPTVNYTNVAPFGDPVTGGNN